MAFRFLLLCLACVDLGLAAPFGDDGRENVRSKRRSSSPPAPPTPFSEILVDFSVRRLGTDLMKIFEVQDDPFCDEGLDAPGNITIHTFYRDRLEDGGGVGDWTFLQRNSAQIVFNSTLNISLAVPLKGEAVQLAVLQVDHAGSHCQPWSIGDLLIKLPNVTAPISLTVPQAK
jgi:hypothetical protein